MNQTELDGKLAGNSLQEYLLACSELPDYVKNGGALNQEIIERALFVNLLPLWAEHADFVAKLEDLTKELVNHSDLLNNEETKTHLIGLSIFVNGLIEGRFDVSGFFWCNNGYMCCSSACKSISAHYATAEKDTEAAYFHELHEWFMSFYHATSDVFRAIMQIKVWNEEMLVGLTNFLNETFKYYGVFEWILSGLYKVVDDPLVKEKVFDHYIGIFTKSRDKLRRQKNKDGADDLTEKLKNLRKLAKGQSV